MISLMEKHYISINDNNRGCILLIFDKEHSEAFLRELCLHSLAPILDLPAGPFRIVEIEASLASVRDKIIEIIPELGFAFEETSCDRIYYFPYSSNSKG